MRGIKIEEWSHCWMQLGGRCRCNTVRNGGYKLDERRQMLWEMNNPSSEMLNLLGRPLILW